MTLNVCQYHFISKGILQWTIKSLEKAIDCHVLKNLLCSASFVGSLIDNISLIDKGSNWRNP